MMRVHGLNMLVIVWLIAKVADVAYQAAERLSKAKGKAQLVVMPIGGVLGALGVYGANAGYHFTPLEQKTAVIGLVIGLTMGIATFTYSLVMGAQDSRRLAQTAYGLAFAIPVTYHFFAFYR